MAKSNEWCLNRLEVCGEFFLNEGDTTIGRNKKADVITPSQICSRNHCVITLDSDNKIHIKNQSSNGTFVNGIKIGDEPHELSHNDTIGLGCEPTIFDIVTDAKEAYYVFRLTKCGEGDVIDLISDDDEETKPVIVNGKVKNENKQMDSAQATSSKLPQEPAPETSSRSPADNAPSYQIESNDDDNELIYSQQVMMEIKQEVLCPDEVVAHEDDFSIYISDESCDGESNNWAKRLSQDQDFVVKKVTESVQSRKRKVTKHIEPIPIVPPKKMRRGSISGSATQKSTMVTKPTAINMKPKDSDKANAVDVTPNAFKTPNSDKTNEPFVDRFDPFALIPKKVEQPKSFEEALIQSPSVTPKRKRVAHVPKCPNKAASPIRRLQDGSWPSDGKRNKVNLKVRFASEKPMIREYEPDDDEVGEILIASPAKPSPSKLLEIERLTSFENDPLHEIITDITEWKPEWIMQRNVTPPINGVNHVVCPLLAKYPSFEHYQKTVIPLLKHELWSSIQGENRNRNRFEVIINTSDLVKRAGRQRYVFNLQIAMESSNSKAHVGDYVIVEAEGIPSFFAYVTNQRFTRSGYTKTTYLTMETSQHVVKLKNSEGTSLCITPIANIRTELKLFNAIFYLNRTPMLKELILDPSSYEEPKIPNRIPEFQYTGYDKLNEEQLEILKSIYNKSLDPNKSLSLIEGPPGTGKTRLIVSIILQLLFGQEMKHKLRILVLAASNAAVDIIARRMIHIRDKMDKADKKKIMNFVRYGMVNSMHPDVLKIASQNLKVSQPLSPSMQCDTIKPMLDEQKRLRDLIEVLRKKENSKNTVIQDQIREHEKRLNQIKETMERKGKESNDIDGCHEILANARVVFSTLSSSINLKQFIRYFDVCFIDEASQCTEPWSLTPLQYNVKSFILVGDSHQLSPVILSPVCRERNFEISLFTRLFDTIGAKSKNCTYAMTTQYRMHPDICAFSNDYFYGKRLTSAPQTVAAHVNFALQPYRVFNLKCLQSNRDMISFYNVGEAEFIVAMLKVMVKHADPKTFSYGIITPYAKQKTEIQHLLSRSNTLVHFDFPVNTIDSYQGQEKDIIILCTTRTTGIGFLANPKRLNVAITRAKKSLIICGNFTSISNIPVWRELLMDANRRGKYFDIKEQYNFKMIADLLIVKTQKPATSNKPPART